MPSVSNSRIRASGAGHLPSLITLVILVGILFFAKPVIVPLALALLLAFILTPLVMALQRIGLKRVPAVLLVVLFTFLIFGVVGWGVGAQVSKLAEDLPAHAGEMQSKIVRLRTSALKPVAGLLKAFQGMGDSTPKAPTGDSPAERRLIVTPPEGSAVSRLGEVAATVLEPVATAGLILILVIFMLIRREDLRNRVIGLLGHGRLTGTTRVFVESAERISRLLLTQLSVNAAFGVIFATALAIIGVPYWFLWGFLTVILRFVPYVGSWLAAAFPVLVSFAISPGLGQPIAVLLVFIVLDLVSGNVIEPLLFGHSTGVSPVALLVAAVFWTWVWGPIGLILSSPLTVCLVVLGQHVPRLRFLSMLLGDQPALAPHVAYYQRLLAGDRNEAGIIAKEHARVHGADRLADDVLVPALWRARRDRMQAGLTAEVETFVFDSTQNLLDENEKSRTPAPVSAVQALPLVLGCPAHHFAEELALRTLADVLAPDGRLEVLSTRMLLVEIIARIEKDQPELIFIAVLPPGGVSQARYLCRQLRKKFADLRIVVGYFGKVRDFDRLLVNLRSAGATYVTTSVLQSRNQLRALLATLSPTKLVESPADSQPADTASVANAHVLTV